MCGALIYRIRYFFSCHPNNLQFTIWYWMISRTKISILQRRFTWTLSRGLSRQSSPSPESWPVTSIGNSVSSDISRSLDCRSHTTQMWRCRPSLGTCCVLACRLQTRFFLLGTVCQFECARGWWRLNGRQRRQSCCLQYSNPEICCVLHLM